MVLPEEDGSVSIYFGHNGYGVQPALGSGIHVDFRTCDGSKQNFDFPTTMEVRVTDDLSQREVTGVTLMTVSYTHLGDIKSARLQEIQQFDDSVWNRPRILRSVTVDENINAAYSVRRSAVKFKPQTGQLEDNVVAEITEKDGKKVITMYEFDAERVKEVAEKQPDVCLLYTSEHRVLSIDELSDSDV